MATLRQTQANRQNALKSTGPGTVEGKDQSRRNALKHGLAGEGVVMPDEDDEAVETRKAEWRDGYRPTTVEGEWLFAQMVVNSVRVDRCARHESEVRTHLALRASLAWDDDRRADAEALGATLPRSPSRVSRALRRTKHGCDWLLERWRMLGAVLDDVGSWTEAQSSLALDLVGTPLEFRDAPPRESPREIVAREIGRLEARLAGPLDALDEHERSAAETGLEIEPGRPLTLLRRYESACVRRFQWARDRLCGRGRPASPEPSPPTPPPPPTPVVLAPPAADPASQMTDSDERELDRTAPVVEPAPASDPAPVVVVESELSAPWTPLRNITLSSRKQGNRESRRTARKLARQR